MREFHLTHIALVGARISDFHRLGINNRNQIAGRRVVPVDAPLEDLSGRDLQTTLAEHLPIWVHNIIVDPDFPARDKLLMALRRFEGELKDKRDNEVISAVLSAGFKNQSLDPLNLPSSLSMRRRCALLAHLETWQGAYNALQSSLTDTLAANIEAVDEWCDDSRNPANRMVEPGLDQVV